MSAHDVYVSTADIKAATGVSDDREDDLARIAVLATQWVLFRVGELTQADNPVMDPAGPYTLTVIATTPGRRAAALAAATRFWNSPQAPFGIIGGLTDAPTYVSGVRIPEAELALLGEKTGFPIG